MSSKMVIRIKKDAGGPGMDHLEAFINGERFIEGGVSGRGTDLYVPVYKPIKHLILKGDGTIELEIGVIENKIM